MSDQSSPIREPEISRTALIETMRQHIKADAVGLAPAVIAHCLVGFEEAADAILNLAPVGGRGEEGSSRADLSRASSSPTPSPAGEGRRPPYVFHSLSSCAGCSASGDYFPSPDAEAYEVTGELYCDECAEEAIALAQGEQ